MLSIFFSREESKKKVSKSVRIETYGFISFKAWLFNTYSTFKGIFIK